MSETMAFMLAALAAELLLLLLVLLGISFLRNRAARRRDQQAVKALVARVRQNKEAREQAIERFLVETLRLSGEPLREAKAALLRAELGLLQRFAGIYRRREADAAAAFDDDLAAALASYHLLNGGDAQVVQQHAEMPAEDAELAALREENARLSNELKINMETMSRMLNEYSTMFAGGRPAEVAPIAAAADGAVDAPAAGDTDPQAPDALGYEEPQPPVSVEDEVEPALPEMAAHAAGEPDSVPQQAPAAADAAHPDGSEEVATINDDEDLFDLLAEAEAAPAAGDAEGSAQTGEAASPDDDDLFDLVASAEEGAQPERDKAPADADVAPLRSHSTG